ncbi:MAG: DUF1844 domain-containing protein [Phycisphaerales bacterium]|nr:DUF1844 domain-containing protein [Phycisphaerales bacterium]
MGGLTAAIAAWGYTVANQPGEGLFIDSDWKEEAKREKEKLAAAEAKAAQEGAGKPRFADLLNLMVMQVMASLGGMMGPGGQPMPPDLQAARYFIDLLGLLEEKTRGNLSEEEKQLLEQVLYELRMEWVRITGAMPPSAPSPSAPAGG